MKKVMFAGDVEPRSRTRRSSSRTSHLMNSLNPVERRCTRSFPVAEVVTEIFDVVQRGVLLVQLPRN